MKTAVVKSIQVGGVVAAGSLVEMAGLLMAEDLQGVPLKASFEIKLSNGTTRTITIRDEDHHTVAYGDFDGLGSFLDYAQETVSHSELSEVEPLHG